MLQRSASIVGTPLPHGLLADLEPFRGWLGVNPIVDRRRRSGRRLTSGVASGALLALGAGDQDRDIGSIDPDRRIAFANQGRTPGPDGP